MTSLLKSLPLTETEILHLLASSFETPEEVLDWLEANAPQLAVQRALAESENISTAMATRLAQHEDPGVRVFVASNSAIDDETRAVLAGDDEAEVRAEVLSWTEDAALLAKHLNDPSPKVRRIVAGNPHTDVTSLKKLLRDLNQAVRDEAEASWASWGAMAEQDERPLDDLLLEARTTTDGAALDRLTRSEHPDVRAAAMTNTNTWMKTVRKVLKSGDEEARASVFTHPSLDVNLARRVMLGDPSPVVRKAGAAWKHAPHFLLETLALDTGEDRDVRITALRCQHFPLTTLTVLVRDLDPVVAAEAQTAYAAQNAAVHP